MDVLNRFREYTEFVDGEIPQLTAYCVIALVWLWSGCVAASIGESRLRSPFLHFLFGLVLPVLYPVIIFFRMDFNVPKEEAAADEEDVEHVEGPPPVVGEDAPAMISEEALGQPAEVFNEEFFKQRAVDLAGNVLGPYLVTVDGQELRAERIVDAMPNVVILEITSAGGKSQTLRVPYDRIEAFKDLN